MVSDPTVRSSLEPALFVWLAGLEETTSDAVGSAVSKGLGFGVKIAFGASAAVREVYGTVPFAEGVKSSLQPDLLAAL